MAPVAPAAHGHQGHRCIHDALVKAPALVVPQRSSPRRRLQQNGAPGLRVIFETATLEGDAGACTAEGESVLIGDAPRDAVACGDGVVADCRLTCGAKHVLTPEKRAALARLLPHTEICIC